MNRRAGIFGMNWAEMIGLVLAVAIVLLVIFPFFGRLFATLLGAGTAEASAKANLVALTAQVNGILMDPKDFVSKRNLQFGLPTDFIIVTFTRGEPSTKVKCAADTSEESSGRPDACKLGTCLCLFEETVGDDVDGETPIMCQPFPKDVIFLGPGGSQDECAVINDVSIPCSEYTPKRGVGERARYAQRLRRLRMGWNWGEARSVPQHPKIGNYDYENLVMYGNCEPQLWHIKPVYLEKFKVGNKIYVYIARESGLSEKRNRKLQEALVPLEEKTTTPIV